MQPPHGITVTFRARKDLGPSRHGELGASALALAESRLWWCGAPCVWTDADHDKPAVKRIVGSLELTFGWSDPIDEAMGARDLETTCAWMRSATDTSWEITIPGAGVAVIGPDVHAALAEPLEALQRRLSARATIDELAAIFERHGDRYGALDRHMPWTSMGLGERAQYIANVKTTVTLVADPQSQEVADELAACAQEGRAGAWTWTANAAPKAIADRATIELGLTPINASWVEITRDRAEQLLARAIQFDLAYGAKRSDPAAAHTLASTWFARFGDEAAVFTNGQWSDDLMGASTPIGSATMDVAFAIVGPALVGVVWLGDED